MPLSFGWFHTPNHHFFSISGPWPLVTISFVSQLVLKFPNWEIYWDVKNKLNGNPNLETHKDKPENVIKPMSGFFILQWGYVTLGPFVLQNKTGPDAILECQSTAALPKDSRTASNTVCWVLAGSHTLHRKNRPRYCAELKWKTVNSVKHVKGLKRGKKKQHLPLAWQSLWEDGALWGVEKVSGQNFGFELQQPEKCMDKFGG